MLSVKVGQHYQPEGFCSRTLSKAERNYAHLEKEGLALVFGVTKFREYLWGRSFTLVTDHKPLVGIFHHNRAVPDTAAARVQRWALLLSAYSYQTEYRKGELNQNADALSRLPQPGSGEVLSADLQEYVLVMEALDDEFIPTTELQRQTTADSVLHQVKI